MSDIVERLRKWVHARDAVPVGDLLDEAADEIDRLRGRWAYSRESDGVQAGEPAHKMEKTASICVLTDAEHQAVKTAISEAESHCHRGRADTLRCLLERLK